MVKDILSIHPEYINKINGGYENCLFIAAKTGNLNMVKYFIEETEININYKTPDGNVLFVAIENSKLDVVDYLLSCPKVKINDLNSFGETIYHSIAKIGNSDLMEKVMSLNPIGISLKSVDFDKRNCLFNLIDNYVKHKDYWCFELIQQELTKEDLLTKDENNQNILDFIIYKQLEIKKRFPLLKEPFEPLIHILKSRVNY